MKPIQPILCAAIFFLMLVLPPFARAQAEWTGNINGFLGAKALDEDEWEPAHEQSELGVAVDFRKTGWPVNIAIDLMSAYGEGYVFLPGAVILAESRTAELNLGFRKIWDHFPHVRPFLGAGVSFIAAEAESSAYGISISDSDQSLGYWAGGGVYWTLGDHFNIGMELKASWADVTLAGMTVNAGGGHFGLLAGYHW
ncbi:hypothetical protein [Desulfosudis oleivorans]|uniref:Outer membrane protein beta-barrel domain-containing protein n=1 Tax=Desulfosudis oleivorans (strain DSM 6200 / JCM 39069 / Hxd3) TaxID=96561 RepID=A8ZYZ6_DESOH|nr:hypothetical protein [Desulfosudis oleivorans]ABW68769.1 hypothetical protein Dole_2966 [Desulfosudis oleivorans Hxd3]